MQSKNDNGWFVYMIRCDDDSLYTGVTTDMVRRWEEHRHSAGQHGGSCKDGVRVVARRELSRGAKFFRARKPVQLAYVESGHDRSSALRREAAIKRLPRFAKLQLLTAAHNELHSLDDALLPSACGCC